MTNAEAANLSSLSDQALVLLAIRNIGILVGGNAERLTICQIDFYTNPMQVALERLLARPVPQQNRYQKLFGLDKAWDAETGEIVPIDTIRHLFPPNLVKSEGLHVSAL